MHHDYYTLPLNYCKNIFTMGGCRNFRTEWQAQKAPQKKK